MPILLRLARPQSVARSNYRLRLLNGFNARTVIISFRCLPCLPALPAGLPAWPAAECHAA
jgi:hypothetical protein